MPLLICSVLRNIFACIFRQMARHREQWHSKKQQSEGKLRSLRKKVDNLDELVRIQHSTAPKNKRKTFKNPLILI